MTQRRPKCTILLQIEVHRDTIFKYILAIDSPKELQLLATVYLEGFYGWSVAGRYISSFESTGRFFIQ